MAGGKEQRNRLTICILCGWYKSIHLHPTSRSRAAVARRAHNPKVGGSNPPFATKKGSGIGTFFNLVKLLLQIHRLGWNGNQSLEKTFFALFPLPSPQLLFLLLLAPLVFRSPSIPVPI